MARFLRFPVLVLLAFAAGLTACVEAPQPSGPVVLAASSLHEALGAAADAWVQEGHARPVLSFAGSSALARQLQSGAPADLFVSADEDWMDTVEREGLLRPGSRKDLLTNEIVLIGPKDATRPAALTGKGLNRVLEAGPLAMADSDSVPAGKYGKAALMHLGLWDSVADRAVRAENVRAALALVESGEAPLGVVYATDAAASDKVRVIARFPDASHPPIRYPMALLASSQNPEADGFERFLASGKGQAIFSRYGFGVIR